MLSAPCQKGYSENLENNLNDPFFRTSPDNIGKKYGGIRACLSFCGVEDRTVDRVKAILTEV